MLFKNMMAVLGAGMLLASGPIAAQQPKPKPDQHKPQKKPSGNKPKPGNSKPGSNKPGNNRPGGHKPNSNHGGPPKSSGHHDNGNHNANRNRYDSRGRYAEPRRIDRNSHVWRGSDGHYHCRRDNGTTGLLVGAGLGALAGNALAGGQDKTIGSLAGGALGAAIGREIDRGNLRCH